MAIQPIDLQTLFTQIDKVGKTQSAQREGLAMQQAIQGVQIQRKTEEHIREVNEAPDSGDGAEKVKDRPARGQEGSGGKKAGGQKNEGQTEADETDEARPIVFRDLSLGRNIDISL